MTILEETPDIFLELPVFLSKKVFVPFFQVFSVVDWPNFAILQRLLTPLSPFFTFTNFAEGHFLEETKNEYFQGYFWAKTADKTARNDFLTIFFRTNSSPISIFRSEMFGMGKLFILQKIFASNLSATHVSPCSQNVSYR